MFLSMPSFGDDSDALRMAISKASTAAGIEDRGQQAGARDAVGQREARQPHVGRGRGELVDVGGAGDRHLGRCQGQRRGRILCRGARRRNAPTVRGPRRK